MGAGMEAESIRVDFLDLEVTITHFGRRSAHGGADCGVGQTTYHSIKARRSNL